MRTLLTAFLLFIQSFLLTGQTPSDQLLPVQINGKYGFINHQGQLIIDAQFDWAADFSEGLAVIQIKGKAFESDKYGYIDSTGRIVIFPVFTAASDFLNGWARVKQEDSRFVYLDKMGRMPIPKKFFECYTVQSLPIPVREESHGKAGYINELGQYVIEPTFEMARPFVDEVAVVAKDGGQGFIDINGNFIIPPIFYRANYFNNGLAKVIVRQDNGDKKEGYINKQGEFVIQPIFQLGLASDFSEGLAAVCFGGNGENWGYINTLGQLIIEDKFERAASFSEGLAKVKMEGKYGFIDQNGQWVIPPKFENVSDFKNGIASVYLKNERMGYINKQGEFIWKAEKPMKKESEKPFYDRY